MRNAPVRLEGGYLNVLLEASAYELVDGRKLVALPRRDWASVLYVTYLDSSA